MSFIFTPVVLNCRLKIISCCCWVVSCSLYQCAYYGLHCCTLRLTHLTMSSCLFCWLVSLSYLYRRDFDMTCPLPHSNFDQDPSSYIFLIKPCSFACKHYNRFCSTSVMKPEGDQLELGTALPSSSHSSTCVSPKFRKYFALSCAKSY